MPASPAKNAIEEISSLDLLKLYILTQERREQKQGVSTLENKEFVEQTLLEAQEAGDSYAQSHGAKTMKKLIDGANFLEKLSSCFANDDEKNEYLRRLEEFKKYIDERSEAASENDRTKTKLTISLCNFLLNCHELDLDVVLLHFPPSKEDQNCFQGTWERLDEMRAAKGLIDSLLQESCDHLAREEVAKVADINRGAEVHFGAYLNKLAVGKIVKEAQTYSSHATNSSIFLYQDSFAGSLRNKFIKLFDETVSLQQIETIIEQALNELKFEIEDDASLSKEQKDFGKKFIDEFLKNKKVQFSIDDEAQTAFFGRVEAKLKKEFCRVFAITKEEAEYFFESQKDKGAGGENKDKFVFEKVPAAGDDYENIVFAIKSEELLARVGKKILSELQELSILMQGRDAIKIGNQKGAAIKPETEPQSENVDIYSQEYYQKMLSLLESGDKWQISRAINYFYSLGKFGSGSATLIAYRNVAFEALLKIKDAIDAKIVEFNEKKSELGRGVVEAEVKLLSRQLELKQLAREVKSGHLGMLLFKERHPKVLTKAKSEIVEIDLEIEKLKTEIDAKRQFLGDENQVQKSSSSIDDLEKEFAEKKQKLEEFEKTENPERDFVYKLSRDRLAEYIEEKNKLLVRLLGNSQDSLAKVFDGDVIEAKPIADIFQSLQSTAADINKLNISQIFSNSTTEKILEFIRSKDAICSNFDINYQDLLHRPNFSTILSELAKTAFLALTSKRDPEEDSSEQEDEERKELDKADFEKAHQVFSNIAAKILGEAGYHKDKAKILEFAYSLWRAKHDRYHQNSRIDMPGLEMDFAMLDIAIISNDLDLIKKAIARLNLSDKRYKVVGCENFLWRRFSKSIIFAIEHCSFQVLKGFLFEIQRAKAPNENLLWSHLSAGKLLRYIAKRTQKDEDISELDLINRQYSGMSFEGFFEDFFDKFEGQKRLEVFDDIDFVVKQVGRINQSAFKVEGDDVGSLQKARKRRVVFTQSLLFGNSFFVLNEELKKQNPQNYDKILKHTFAGNLNLEYDQSLLQNFLQLDKESAKKLIEILFIAEDDLEERKKFIIAAIKQAIEKKLPHIFKILFDEAKKLDAQLLQKKESMEEFGLFLALNSGNVDIVETVVEEAIVQSQEDPKRAKFLCDNVFYYQVEICQVYCKGPLSCFSQDLEKFKKLVERIKEIDKDFLKSEASLNAMSSELQVLAISDFDYAKEILKQIKGKSEKPSWRKALHGLLFDESQGNLFQRAILCNLPAVAEFAIEKSREFFGSEEGDAFNSKIEKALFEPFCTIKSVQLNNSNIDYFLEAVHKFYDGKIWQDVAKMKSFALDKFFQNLSSDDLRLHFLQKIMDLNNGDNYGKRAISMILRAFPASEVTMLSVTSKMSLAKSLVLAKEVDVFLEKLKAFYVEKDPSAFDKETCRLNMDCYNGIIGFSSKKGIGDVLSIAGGDYYYLQASYDSSPYSSSAMYPTFRKIAYNAVVVNVLNGSKKSIREIISPLYQDLFSFRRSISRFEPDFLETGLQMQDYKTLKTIFENNNKIFSKLPNDAILKLTKHFLEIDYSTDPKKNEALDLLKTVFDLSLKQGRSINAKDESGGLLHCICCHHPSQNAKDLLNHIASEENSERFCEAIEFGMKDSARRTAIDVLSDGEFKQKLQEMRVKAANLAGPKTSIISRAARFLGLGSRTSRVADSALGGEVAAEAQPPAPQRPVPVPAPRAAWVPQQPAPDIDDVGGGRGQQ